MGRCTPPLVCRVFVPVPNKSNLGDKVSLMCRAPDRTLSLPRQGGQDNRRVAHLSMEKIPHSAELGEPRPGSRSRPGAPPTLQCVVSGPVASHRVSFTFDCAP